MKRIALAAGLLLVAAALAGVLRPDGAGAADPATATYTVTVTGTGSVEAVPDRAEVSAGVETRAPTARAALSANGAAMQKVIAALRAGGGKDVTTQTVSLSTGFDQNGQPNGFKLYAIRPSSVYAKIGLMNGDTIHAVNGFELTSLDKGLEVYTKVKESTSLSVSITRRGKPLNLSYSIK